MIDLSAHVSYFAGQRVALLDLDGVICDERHRTHHALDRDWGTYFELMVRDRVWPQGRALADGCTYAGWRAAYLTGRREDTRVWTVGWLHEHGFDTDVPLLMRPLRQRAPLAELKAAVVREVLRHASAAILYDDDPAVIAEVARVRGARAHHCTWHVKPARMVTRARA